ncbi:hypothetical protein LCGC14_2639950 [marine sediment metagenome]|uniref:Uncharacterized protein n=1 Tax=marine sediment metagenome TaxID=412755 RepID=A0A0F8ZXZ1_9ZZZZ
MTLPRLPRYFVGPRLAVDQLLGRARFIATELESGWYIFKVEEFNDGEEEKFGLIAGVERLANVLSRQAISAKLSSGMRTRLAKHGISDADDTMTVIDKLDARFGGGLLP